MSSKAQSARTVVQDRDGAGITAPSSASPGQSVDGEALLAALPHPILVVSADGRSVELAGGTVPMPAGLATSPVAGSKVILGIRPEHLTVTDDGPLVAEVRAVEWLGHECLITAETGGQTFIVRQAGMSASEAGSTVKLAAAATDVHLFDPETTGRLT